MSFSDDVAHVLEKRLVLEQPIEQRVDSSKNGEAFHVINVTKDSVPLDLFR